MREEIKQKLKDLPSEPGCYLMKDSNNVIIYVGKAKNLKSRVKSYFTKSTNHNRKTKALIKNIASFDIMIVSTEVESLLLERTLIKHHQPEYNILLRDDKEYPYIKIDYNNPWPRIKKIRKRKDDNAKYIGPFANTGHLNLMLQVMRRIFPTIKCSPHEFQNAKRPCNYYHIKMCLAPCVLEVDRKKYLEVIDSAISFLKGQNKHLINEIKTKMKEASNNLEYESAAYYRDQLIALENFKEKQAAVVQNIEEADFIGFQQNDTTASIHILNVRSQHISGGENYTISTPIQEEESALSSFLLQFYENKHTPAELYTPFELKEAALLAEALNNKESKRTKILVPKQGEKKQLIDIANRNALYALEEHIRSENKKSTALLFLQKTLNLSTPPHRIECIDISNIQGTAIVASDVCFINAKPYKPYYRLYNIEDQAEAPDDFQSIYLVMKRRIARGIKEKNLADLFVIDGGKGQLKSAMKAASEFPQTEISIISLAKKRFKGQDTSEHAHSKERIFLPQKDTPIELKEGSPEFRLLTHMRDEAHRFAITHHRKRRKKVLHTSILDQIPGIGAKMRIKLYETFTDLEGIKKASLEELSAIKGLRKDAALSLYTQLRLEDENAE